MKRHLALLAAALLSATLLAAAGLALAQSGYLAPDRYVDGKNGFSIYPPAGWWMDTKNRRFAVKFSSNAYDAFITVDVVPLEGEVEIDNEFINFINQKNEELKKKLPGVEILRNTKTTVNNMAAYRTDISFVAGKTPVSMKVHYVPAGKRLYMLTTVSPDYTSANWAPVFQESLNTFTVIK